MRDMVLKELKRLTETVPSAVFKQKNAGNSKPDRMLRLADIFSCTVEEV